MALRRAKIRQAKTRQKRELEETDWRKAREETLRETIKRVIGMLIVLRDIAGEIGQLMTNLYAEFEKLPNWERKREAGHYLERLNDLKKERQKVLEHLDEQLNMLMEMQTELDELTGIGEGRMLLMERKGKT